MSGSGTEYLRKITFSCPVCLNSVSDKVWVGEPGDFDRVVMNCPVCGAAMLRIDSRNDEVRFSAFLDMRKWISERIGEQRGCR